LGRSLLMFKNWLKKSDHREVSHHLKNNDNFNFWRKLNFVVIIRNFFWTTVKKTLCRFDEKGWDFEFSLRSIEQSILSLKCQNNFCNALEQLKFEQIIWM
jgi:hypothetical protein